MLIRGRGYSVTSPQAFLLKFEGMQMSLESAQLRFLFSVHLSENCSSVRLLYRLMYEKNCK